jgi:hypothetical protein
VYEPDCSDRYEASLAEAVAATSRTANNLRIARS